MCKNMKFHMEIAEQIGDVIWSKNPSCRCPTHEPHFWRRFMINQAWEILPLGQSVRILNICAEEPAVATTFKLPLSRNTSAGRPVAPDTAPLPLSFLPPFGRETISPCPGGCAPRGNAPHIAAALAAAKTPQTESVSTGIPL